MADFQDAYKKIKPSVVGLGTYQDGLLEIIGTGFFVCEDGWILTNKHVIHRIMKTKLEMCAYLFPEVHHKSGLTSTSMLPATIIEKSELKANKKTPEDIRMNGKKADKIIPPQLADLELCKIDPEKLPPESLPIKPAKLINSQKTLVGLEIGIIGFPLGLRFSFKNMGPEIMQFTPILQVGHISAYLPFTSVNSQLDMMIDHVIVGGSSGSPVFDKNGDVCGIVRAYKHESYPMHEWDEKNRRHNLNAKLLVRVPSGLCVAVPTSRLPKEWPWGRKVFANK